MMYDGELTPFRDLLHERFANNPTGWNVIAKHLDHFATVIKGSVFPNLAETVRSAEQAAAVLFCAALSAKQANVDLSFRSMIDQAPGKSFGAKLINWAINKVDVDLADDLRVAWGSLHQQMAGTIEMMIRQLEPNITAGTELSPDQAVEWIRRHGGIGKLHMEYMNFRRMESSAEKIIKENDRKLGAVNRRMQEAKKAGFDTVEAYDTHIAKMAEERREVELKTKFGELKKKLAQAGTKTLAPEDGRLLLCFGGAIFVLSERDEYALLSCAASVM